MVKPTKTRFPAKDRTSELVGEGGVEPPRPFGHRTLNPARLPIPPLAQWRNRHRSSASRSPGPSGTAERLGNYRRKSRETTLSRADT